MYHTEEYKTEKEEMETAIKAQKDLAMKEIVDELTARLKVKPVGSLSLKVKEKKDAYMRPRDFSTYNVIMFFSSMFKFSCSTTNFCTFSFFNFYGRLVNSS